MKTGIQLIAKERKEQIEKHGYTNEIDIAHNGKDQLRSGAKRLLEISPDPLNVPYDWSQQIWEKMCNKSEMERLIIAGALIAAEIDRLNSLKK